MKTKVERLQHDIPREEALLASQKTRERQMALHTEIIIWEY